MTHVAETIPYPWPYDGRVVPSRTALVVAGAQRAWPGACDPDSPVRAAIATVAAALRARGGTVVWIRHTAARADRPSPLPPAASDPGWALALEPEAGDVVVDAWGADGFHASRLDGELRGRGITHLALSGFGAEVAVDGTLRRANDQGYECLTLVDAVAPCTPDTGRHALSSITMSGGIFGAIGTSTALLTCLEELP